MYYIPYKFHYYFEVTEGGGGWGWGGRGTFLTGEEDKKSPVSVGSIRLHTAYLPLSEQYIAVL